MLALISSSDWIGLGVIALLIIAALFGLRALTRPYDVKNEEEFQKRRQESPGLMVAGLKGLQEVLDPAEKKAAIVRQDLERGIYDDQEEADDPPDGGGRQNGTERDKG
jgi:hypothetical protein